MTAAGTPPNLDIPPAQPAPRTRFWWIRILWGSLIGAALTVPATPGPSFLRLSGSRLRKVLISLTAIIVVFGLSAAAWGELWGTGRLDLMLSLSLAALMTAPLLLIGWGPLWTWRAMTVGLALCGSSGAQRFIWPWPVTTVILYLAVIFLLATMYDRQTLIGMSILTVLFVVVPSDGRYSSTVAIVLSAVVGVVLLIGDAIRGRREAENDLANVISAQHEDAAQRAVLDERTRIARELHDVVAHHMSMIAIQAEAAPYKFKELSPEAEETFALIRDTSKQALTEMRRVVGLLRESDESPERTPQPTLDHLDELINTARRSGMTVHLATEGTVVPVPTAVDVSAYRIIQEGLGNASRHAPGKSVEITIHYLPDSIELRICNDLVAHSDSSNNERSQRRGFWRRKGRTNSAASGGGHGLVGMRERVAIVEGHIEVGANDDEKFTIVAILPTNGMPLPSNDLSSDI